MTTKIRIVTTAAAAAALLLLAQCRGGGGDEEPDDAEELAELRAQVEYTYEPAQVEELLTAALDIATRNEGDPLGAEAFAFAQEIVLSRYPGQEAGPFADRTAAPPVGLEDSYVQNFRNLAGFLAVVPAPYVAGDVSAQFHSDLMERGDSTLDELEWARNNRLEWATELTADGETKASWFGLLAILDGNGFSMGSMDSEEFQEEALALEYVLTLAAAAGEPADVLTGLGLLVDAVKVADYVPPSLETKVEDGVIVTVYTEEAVAGGSANAQALAVAIDAARAYFPPLEQ